MSCHSRILALLAGFSLSALHAQVAGTISGFVRDPTGAAVPSANVTAVLTGQQLTRSAVTDSTGFFNLLAMQPGAYEITITAPGFREAGPGRRAADLRRKSAPGCDAQSRLGAERSHRLQHRRRW